MTDPFASLYPVMQKYGVTCSPDEFQRTVNLLFHKAESQVYDDIHRCMWETLPQQIQLLTEDLEAAGATPRDNSVLLDIGCGTGLATDLLLQTRTGKTVAEVDLLDTSAEMLEKARAASKSWGVRTNFLNAEIESIVRNDRKYDIIVISSVLHHIPDLASFLRTIRSLQAPAGVLIHLQDPNGDFLEDAVLKERMAELSRHFRRAVPKWLQRLTPRRVAAKIRCQFGGRQPSDYIREFNDELLASGIVHEEMTPPDIWTVTDIHIYNGCGVSVSAMQRHLCDLRLISRRSYAFFGRMLSELPPSFRLREERLLAEGAQNGLYVSAVWQSKSSGEDGR